MATKTGPSSAQAEGREDRCTRPEGAHRRPSMPAGLTRHCPGPTWHGWPLLLSSAACMSPSVKDIAFHLHTCGPAALAYRYVTVADLVRDLGYATRSVQEALEELVRDGWIAPGELGTGRQCKTVAVWWLCWKLPEEEGADDREEPASDDPLDLDEPFTLGGGGAP